MPLILSSVLVFLIFCLYLNDKNTKNNKLKQEKNKLKESIENSFLLGEIDEQQKNNLFLELSGDYWYNLNNVLIKFKRHNFLIKKYGIELGNRRWRF